MPVDSVHTEQGVEAARPLYNSPAQGDRLAQTGVVAVVVVVLVATNSAVAVVVVVTVVTLELEPRAISFEQAGHWCLMADRPIDTIAGY